ncbi:MAG TPA: hypothetical protein VMG31_08610 [Verrucomicrobiae bacterium]|nr:hypothetical protein [Verrucomicrobiae bacterium]
MPFNRNLIMPGSRSGLLEEAAARIGLSPTQMEELLDCELNIDHLIAYIDALMSDRMN